MARIQYLELRVADEKTPEFYEEALGFEKTGPKGLYCLPEQKVGLRFQIAERSKPFQPEKHHGYWKIGLTTPNVDLVRASIVEKGWQVSEADQFRDIGYLCHLRDPSSLPVELLQHEFHKPPEATGPAPLKLAHITLRIGNPEASLTFYRDVLNMSLLSVQPVEPYGFTLYFLADTDERPPDPELQAVSNRPWLWRRPYPVLELQHIWDLQPQPAQQTDIGFVHIGFENGCREVLDPDGHALWVP